MKRFINITFLLLLAVLPKAGAEEKPAVSYDAAADRLTLEVHDMPVEKALGLIAAEAGFEVFIDDGVEAKVSLLLTGVPLERGINRLLKGISHVMIFQGGPSPRLETVKVYAAGKGGELRYSSPPQRGDRTVTPNQPEKGRSRAGRPGPDRRQNAGDPDTGRFGNGGRLRPLGGISTPEAEDQEAPPQDESQGEAAARKGGLDRGRPRSPGMRGERGPRPRDHEVSEKGMENPQPPGEDGSLPQPPADASP